MSLLEKDKKYVWHPFTQASLSPDLIPVVKAEGVWVIDEKGNKYIDANSSWWTVLHGHGNQQIIDGITKQINSLDHIIFAGATHPKAVEIAERLVELLPGNFSKAFFSDNGSTAIEVAIKMVYQYWHNKSVKKGKFLAIEGAYHGDTFGAMSVGERDFFNKPFEHLFFDVDYLPFPTKENANDVLSLAKKLMAEGNYAGFIFEPLVQGAAGMRIYDAEVLNELIKLAKANDVITIADEVMTGFYRLGTMFALDQIEEEVDIVCLSKGLTGGVMAMGLTITTEAIFEAFKGDDLAKAFLHGHSFTGNPIASAAACASLGVLLTEESKSKVAMISEMHAQICELWKGKKGIRDIGSKGTILRIDVDVDTKASYFSSLRYEAYQYFLENGILIRPLGNVIFVNPPYCISKEELQHIYHHIDLFIERIQKSK
ncbi:adenosylmethionine--8-amino-7-oxononanoate transaminase [Paracrocinitomix mangrovi]|uniref:adenosylmethionine--8-amino-7-oxononanoate transaminase n=1 Tax=Paracrocinitomix mangrovi TaxID=2862509 RepID=UPI001C8DC005|nr:adenosylmethionine--8-amino-7-oxononanoate transaminase [Paracrocinitomix mangrovi]UKN01664.1 adenosylmethionine--8-amino-7-oxononanoate transaminase [Paracrocinitomix mangrovi]